MKIPKHITASKSDKCNSVRFVCSCGTHFNTDPNNASATLKWIKKHE